MSAAASPFKPCLSISASAGCGKTYTLAHRVLRLLAMGARPDSIGAYTFSRKAAGEIFDAIVGYLRAAAADEASAARTSAAMGLPRHSADFLRDLRALLAQVHRLRIGTLDSRIAQMLAAAALELGLPPEFSLLDSQGAEARFLHEQILDSLLAPGVLSAESREAFLDAFELTTQGLAENALDRKLLEMISDHRSVFLLFPDSGSWRHPDGTLRVENPPRALEEGARRLLADGLRESLRETAPPELLELIGQAVAYAPGKRWSSDRPSGALAERLVNSGEEEIVYKRRPVDLTPEQRRGLSILLRHPAGVELERAWMQTRGLHGLLSAFEERYQRTALARGALAFEDACSLMTRFHGLTPGALAFRMDGEVSHWLLDEFQDTSTLQWRAVEPFVDEVLQDPGGERSFFYVGDVKQAIYGWRGGNADLFETVRERYAEKIQVEPMDVSQRSAPAVLDLVNLLMDGVPEAEGFPSGAAAKWNRQFRPHSPAERLRSLPGMARVIECSEKEEAAEVDLMAEILRGLPKGLDVAVLVRSNRRGAELADGLRRKGFEVVLEGQSALRNDTAVEVVLAALTRAAHPGDRFAGRVLELAGWNPDPHTLLHRLHAAGFARTVLELTREIPLSTPNPAFSQNRLRKLVETAQEFDRLDLPSVDRFLACVDRAFLREHEARDVIRLMTIHQSKGLGFDVVLLPLTASMSFSSVETHSLVTSAENIDPGWVLSLPPKEVCTLTGGLDAEYARLQAESAYENLCNLYVALTRAKQGLFVLLPPAPARAGSMNVMPNWIRHRLTGRTAPPEADDCAGGRTLAAFGAEGLPAPERPVRREPAPAPLPLREGDPVIPRLEPSRADEESKELGQTFRRIAVDGRELGSRVHAILEKLTWTDETDADSLLQACGEPGDSPAAAHVRSACALEALRRPPGVKQLWREQHFESVLPEGWVTGIFDRVVIFEDSAWIQDFKTNLRSDASTLAHYAPQMDLYRKVLADMLGLQPGSVRCQLLFTHTGEVHDL